MALEALSSSSNDLLNFLIYDNLIPTPFDASLNSSENNIITNMTPTIIHHQDQAAASEFSSLPRNHQRAVDYELAVRAVRGKKKRRKKPRVCKNREDAETQRMTHIAVERNRRKQMNEHLAMLRSLMPESYAQRGDQASIVGGAIEFIKELEQQLQTLEAQKVQPLLQQQQQNQATSNEPKIPQLSDFFLHTQFSANHTSIQENKHTPSRNSTNASMADIDVTLIETHANIRILSRKRSLRSSPMQHSKLVAGLRSLCLSVLHLNVTTVDTLVLYSISTKVEESCQLSSVDDIAGAVHHLLRIIEEEEAMFCSPSTSIPEIPFNLY